jgi:adenylate cyclase class IV
MSGPLSDFFDEVECGNHKQLIYIEYDKNDYDLMDKLFLKESNNPSNKELRLALDLIDYIYPLFKGCEIESKEDALRSIFKITVTPDKLKHLNLFKKIVFKRVITIKKNKIIFKKVLKN